MKPVLVGVVSDSHGRFRPLERMVSQAPDVAAWIHCGDYSDDGDDLAIYTGVPVYSVRGNNDFMSDAPACRKVIFGGQNWRKRFARPQTSSLFYRSTKSIVNISSVWL